MLAKKVYTSLQLSLQTDILHYNHDCHVVIMMCHKYASGETVTFIAQREKVSHSLETKVMLKHQMVVQWLLNFFESLWRV